MLDHNDLRASMSNRRRIRDELKNWRRTIDSTEPIDRAATKSAIDRFYAVHDLEPPQIIFCQSPFQVAVGPLVMQMALKSAGLRNKMLYLAERSRSTLWKNLWLVLVEQMRGMDGAIDDSANLWEGWSSLKFTERKLYAYTESVGFSSEDDRIVRQLLEDESLLQLGNNLAGEVGNHIRWHSDYRILPWQLTYQIPKRERKKVFEKIWEGNRFLPPGRFENALVLRFQNAMFQPREFFWGSWDLSALMFVKCLASNAGRSGMKQAWLEDMQCWLDVGRQAFACEFFDKVCFVSDRPVKLHYNSRGQLHHESEAAIEFSDGYQIHSWNGVAVPPYVIENPELIAVQSIESEQNAEVRRVKIERFGQSRYVLESQAEVVCVDECGTLYRKNLSGDEALSMVRVINSTPELDGERKEYFLRVPPIFRSARAAVAWTFGLEENEYRPNVET